MTSLCKIKVKKLYFTIIIINSQQKIFQEYFTILDSSQVWKRYQRLKIIRDLWMDFWKRDQRLKSYLLKQKEKKTDALRKFHDSHRHSPATPIQTHKHKAETHDYVYEYSYTSKCWKHSPIATSFLPQIKGVLSMKKPKYMAKGKKLNIGYRKQLLKRQAPGPFLKYAVLQS